MRNGHRGSAHLRLAVYLGLVLRNDLRVVCSKEMSRDREGSITINLRDTGLLKKLESPATRANENLVCTNNALIVLSA